MRGTAKFIFRNQDDFEDGRLTFQLARMSAEGIFGEVRVRLELTSSYNIEDRAIEIDGSNIIGETLIRILTRLLTREFGERGFEVRRVSPAAGTADVGTMKCGALPQTPIANDDDAGAPMETAPAQAPSTVL